MSETYTRMTMLKLGMLHDQIIKAMPVYKFNKSYSCLISAPPPLNSLLLFIVPYFIFSKNEA